MATDQLPALKDHELRDLVNRLRDVAVKFHAAEQLRERIRGVLFDGLKIDARPPAPEQPADPPGQAAMAEGEPISNEKLFEALRKIIAAHDGFLHWASQRSPAQRDRLVADPLGQAIEEARRMLE